MSRVERFAPAPPRVGPATSLGVQFVVACCVLRFVHPPFVCDAEGRASVAAVVGVAALSTALVALLALGNGGTGAGGLGK